VAGNDPSRQDTVLRLSGEIDIASCRGLDHQLRGNTGCVVVDLSKVTLLSAAAIGVLIAHAERLADAGGGLLVVAGTSEIRRLLRVTQAEDVLDVRDSVADARQRRISRGGDGAPRPVDFHGGEDRGLRRRLQTQPTVARALGVLQERYGLRDADLAFELLRTSSQRHNLRLHVVAAALLVAPAPDKRPGDRWFPGRLPQPAPPLTFASEPVAHGANRTAVLGAVLDAVSACVDTDMADLQMADIHPEELYLERHRGLTAELLNFIDSGASTLAAPTAALRRRVRVVVTDVATDATLTDPAERVVLLANGSRALQSSPLPTTSGGPAGVVTTHHPRPGRAPTPAEHTRLDTITAEAGAWLEWHRRTVILDALEHVHESARAIRAAEGGNV
jgi:anti-anti-sigma factor